MIENFFIVGQFDGSNIWVQWDQAALPPESWQVRVRFRNAGAADWETWLPPRKCVADWFKFATNRRVGTQVQAQIEADGSWLDAVEARFARATCKFQFLSEQRNLHYLNGTIFTRAVDGAVCSYRLGQEIELLAGEPIEIEMQSTLSSGYAQIDKPGDFLLRPALGVVIRNIAPSESNIIPTGRDFTVIGAFFDGPPVSIAVTPKTQVT